METITLNGKTYYSEPQEIVTSLQEGATVAHHLLGKNVIVRSRNEGVNCGTVVAADNTGVVLTNARRLWYHKPADTNLSWYEGVAISGLSEDSKVSPTVSMKVIIEDYSMTAVTEEAYNSIMSKVCVKS